MSLFSSFTKLFKSSAQSASAFPIEEYKGYSIQAQTLAANGQFRVSAMISKTINEELKEHQFIRSDTCSSASQAAELAQQKCRNFIDQMGDEIFS